MQPSTNTALQALVALLLLGFLMSALGQSIPFLSDLTQSEAPASASPSSGPHIYSYDIIETYPHDPNAFTQGLDYDKVDGADVFWESTGATPLQSFNPIQDPLLHGNVWCRDNQKLLQN